VDVLIGCEVRWRRGLFWPITEYVNSGR